MARCMAVFAAAEVGATLTGPHTAARTHPQRTQPEPQPQPEPSPSPKPSPSPNPSRSLALPLA